MKACFEKLMMRYSGGHLEDARDTSAISLSVQVTITKRHKRHAILGTSSCGYLNFDRTAFSYNLHCPSKSGSNPDEAYGLGQENLQRLVCYFDLTMGVIFLSCTMNLLRRIPHLHSNNSFDLWISEDLQIKHEGLCFPFPRYLC